MKTIDFIPKNVYTCQFCGKEFENKVELVFWWFCSNSCRYKLAFLIAKKYNPTAEQEQLFTETKWIAGCLK